MSTPGQPSRSPERATKRIYAFGPIAASCGAGAVALGPLKQRALLGALLCRRGGQVLCDELIDALWSSRPPTSATSNLRTYVYGLRQALGEGVITGNGRPGYRLQVDLLWIDTEEFSALCAEADEVLQRGDLSATRAALAAATALRRGPAYADLSHVAPIADEAGRLEQRWLLAVEQRMQADLSLGQAAELVGELTTLVGLHPYREKFVALLMISLYRSGRQSDALAVYRRTTKVLAEELGIDPGPALSELHRAMLRHDPQLHQPNGSAEPPPGAGNLMTRWRQTLRVVSGDFVVGSEYEEAARAAAQVRVHDALPQDLPGFVGRAAELDRIQQAVRVSGACAEAVVISALEGMAGIGKTQLAIHLGHVLAREEPFDRVLFVNLRGFQPDPAQPPADPAAVLDGFLRLLGMSGQQVPRQLADRASAYRARLAGTRSLVVLDNAADEEQVRPLLPGTPGCLTLVTSRRSLAGLDTAIRFDVDVFTPAESLQFLTTAVPAVPVGDDPAAQARIALRCGHLPLALALVAGHMRAKPGWTLTDHADWLDERHRDRRLDSGLDLALEVSYRNLSVEERALLRLLAQHPGPDIDVYAAAALSATDLDLAGARLRELCADHLVQAAGSGRYVLHDLVRAYAAARAADEDRRTDRRAALTRLVDYYLAAAAAAMNRLDPAEPGRRPKVAPSPVALPDLTEPIAWLDAERANLVAIVVLAADHDWPGQAVSFSAVLFRYLLGRYPLDALTVHGRAAQATNRSGDLTGRASALTDLSSAEVYLGRHEAALDHLHQAWKIFRDAGDVPGQARTLNNLSVVETRLGHYQDAAEHLLESLTLHRRTANLTGQARALTNLGNLRSRMSRDQDAIGHYDEALRLYRATGDRAGEALLLTNLGGAEVKLNRYDEADKHLTQAVDLARELHNTAFEASTLDFFGTLHSRRGDAERAAACHREAMTLFRRSGDRHGESCAHNGLGEAARIVGRLDEAIAEHTAAYTIAVEPDIADLEQQARAYTGLADAYCIRGDLPEARQHYRLARELWAEMSSPEADRVAEVLATLQGT